ncbi:hypothetical protein LEP1GSC192_3097 [Leptospira sp. B5-022]|nr:hypothetical protein LEP1GSC192_3097 [Leptospira sp. B5-022]
MTARNADIGSTPPSEEHPAKKEKLNINKKLNNLFIRSR